jgi:hypothetical protein
VIEIVGLNSHQALGGDTQGLIRIQLVGFFKVSLRFVVLRQLHI